MRDKDAEKTAGFEAIDSQTDSANAETVEEMSARLKEYARQAREKPRTGYVLGVALPVLSVDGKDHIGYKDEEGIW